MTPEHVIIPDAYAFFWYAIPIAAAILLVSALVTIIRAQRLSTATRVGWLVVVVLLPVVGSILWLLYYRAVARLPRQSTEAQSVGAEL
ncbi:phospholipase D-like protein [Rathayibacter tanaceti]|uniref:Phospholipase D-like protein n=2 Tax=Rathayibacter tanaceti TaxID=1671680 RepID=A0ACD2XHU5_9MICO|nr:PLDc N-terminal domain-containing protein [Rathayibacter tanaceti]QHC56669.1 hypothetical protein GSU10_14235 [Rathayibacter tanaceti]TCO36180.1 phospholipase D-like protein [Rathayibacter tanaceti]